MTDFRPWKQARRSHLDFIMPRRQGRWGGVKPNVIEAIIPVGFRAAPLPQRLDERN